MRGYKRVTNLVLRIFWEEKEPNRFEEVVETKQEEKQRTHVLGTRNNIWQHLRGKKVCLNTDWKSKLQGRKWLVTLESEEVPFLLYSGSQQDFQVVQTDIWTLTYAFPNHCSRPPLPFPIATLFFSKYLSLCDVLYILLVYLFIAWSCPNCKLNVNRDFLDCFIPHDSLWNII